MRDRDAITRQSLLDETALLVRFSDAYLADRRFLAADPKNLLLLFLDSKEIKSYVDPDAANTLDGFLWRFERLAQETRRTAIALRNDQILGGLLFDPKQPCGIMTSHTEEMEREVEFRHTQWFDRTLKLLDRAFAEIKKNQKMLERFVKVAAGQEAAFVRTVQKHAPALIAVLSNASFTAHRRIQAVLTRSELTLFEEMPWEQFGVPASLAGTLAAAIPTPDEIIGVRDQLRTFKYRANTPEANYIDAAALAQLMKLRTLLHVNKITHIRLVLVSRARTLLRASDEMNVGKDAGELPVRHPRMLALTREEAAPLDDPADLTLGAALGLWRGAATDLPADDYVTREAIAPAVDALITAWDSFETSRLALETKWRSTPTPADAAHDAQALAQRLIKMFSGADAPEKLLRECMVDDFVKFSDVSSKFLLGQQQHSLRARLASVPGRKRVFVTPLVPAPAGPIQVEVAAGLIGAEGELSLDDVAARVEPAGERSLVWALALACAEQWRQAALFAVSALKLFDLVGNAEGADEARLLRAEIRRLSAAGDTYADESPDPAARYAQSEQELERILPINAARRSREAAAQLLEAALAKVPFNDLPDRLRAHFDALDQAADTWQNAAERARCIALLLLLALYDWRYHAADPALSEQATETARRRHLELITLFRAMHDAELLDEMPRRARAMELIGYAMFDDPAKKRSGLRLIDIPENVRTELTELRGGLRSSSDKIGKMLDDELAAIQDRLHKIYTPELSLVPIPVPDAAAALGQLPPEVLDAYNRVDEIGWALFRTGPGVEADRGLNDAIATLTAAMAGKLDTQERFHVTSSLLYARLLDATMEPRHARPQRFAALREAYRAFSADNPGELIPLIRLAYVAERVPDPACVESVLCAARKIVAHPAAGSHGPSWLQSLVRRRYAVIVKRRDGGDARWTGPTDSAEAEAQSASLAEMCRLLFDAEQADVGPPSDDAHSLEQTRRRNNIVFYGARLIERAGERAGQLFPPITLLNEYAALLVPNLAKATDLDLLHSVGCYYAAIGSSKQAFRAGRRIVALCISDERRMTGLNWQDSHREALIWFEQRAAVLASD
jgi:hypothetical protein